MGYTHYFPDLRATIDVIADARKIIDASSVTICGPDGQGLPLLNEAEGIRLNVPSAFAASRPAAADERVAVN